MTAQRIESGTTEGNALGFTDELFSGWLELKSGRRLYLHYIISRSRDEGNTQALIGRWLEQGYDVRVVMPRPVMRHILEKFGFLPLQEFLPDQYGDPVEVWYRPASRAVSRIQARCPAGRGSTATFRAPAGATGIS